MTEYEYIPPKTPINKKAWFAPVVGGVALIMGISLGSLGGSAEPETVEVAGPTVTVTPEPVTETVTETVTVVSDDCLAVTEDAATLLELSGEYVSIIADLSDISSRGIEAAAAWDADTLDSINDEVTMLLVRMDNQQAIIDGLEVVDHTAGCRAGA